MGDRLLHRRLREWANGNPDPMLKKCLHAHLAGSDLCKAHPSCTRCERAQAAALADEIERQYVPVPRTVNCTFEDEMFDFNPEKLTHKEPDSLEKLRDDLMAAHESWDGDPNKLVDYADRLTALMERGA